MHHRNALLGVLTMILSAQIALACDGINIHTAILDHAITADGFMSVKSYEAMELECAERRLRSAADKIAEQRKRLVENEPASNVERRAPRGG
jgi:hypothetical protein